MRNAKALLDNLLGSLARMHGGQGARGLTDKAKEAWNNQSTLGKGAIAGGLLGILMTRGGRRLLGSGARIGGVALIGGLAYRAYTDWKAGRDAATGAGAQGLLAAGGTEFLPDDPEAADDLATRILQAMIAAARADGHVTAEERARIEGQLDNLGLSAEAAALVAGELDAPLDAARVAALARNDHEATELYAASLLVVDQDSDVERDYLDRLAAALRLEPGLVAHLHARAAELA